MCLLMYADDTAILANSAAELQQLIDCTDSWCLAHGMTISIAKTEVLVFNTTRIHPRGTWHLRGAPLTVTATFKYLGVWFHHLKGAGYGLHKAATRGKFAVACLHRKLKDLDVGSNMALSLHLYASMTLPAMLYGCEIWGTELMKVADPTCSQNVVEVVHRNFIKFTLRVKRNTKAWIVHRESGTYPLQYTCLHRMLMFHDRVQALDDREYVKIAMQDCIADAHRGITNWASHVNKLVTHVSADASFRALHPVAGGTNVDVDRCLSSWRKHYHTIIWRGLEPDPRVAPTDNITLCTYHAWFASDLPDDDGCWAPAPCITAHNVPYSHLMSLLKLRTGSHDLAVASLRQARPRPPRAERLCTWCDVPAAVQDELHCVMECTTLNQQRLQYASVFCLGNLHTIFTDTTITAPLASFVHNHIITSKAGEGPLAT
jgi:Reverse transcriptase (RNA-dependent DNA polymerase)